MRPGCFFTRSKQSLTICWRFESLSILFSSGYHCFSPGGGAAVTDLLGLHRLAFAAIGDRENFKIIADGVNTHEKVAGVGGEAAVAINLSQPAVVNFINQAGSYLEIFPGFGN